MVTAVGAAVAAATVVVTAGTAAMAAAIHPAIARQFIARRFTRLLAIGRRATRLLATITGNRAAKKLKSKRTGRSLERPASFLGESHRTHMRSQKDVIHDNFGRAPKATKLRK